MTPLRLLELFYDDVLVDMTVGYTKLYNHKAIVYISFEITNEEILLFLSMQLLSGCHKLPDRKIYLERTPKTFV